MRTKNMSAKFSTNPGLGDHFVIEVNNKEDKKNKKLIQYFTVDANNLKLRLTVETALKLAEFIDEALHEYDFEKRLTKSRKDA